MTVAPTRIVLAGGRDGRAYFPYQCAARLADPLGTKLVEFPGNDPGAAAQPEAFAETLHDVLRA